MWVLKYTQESFQCLYSEQSIWTGDVYVFTPNLCLQVNSTGATPQEQLRKLRQKLNPSPAVLSLMDAVCRSIWGILFIYATFISSAVLHQDMFG